MPEGNRRLRSPGSTAASSSFRARQASSTESVLYNFTGGNDGGNAATGLVFDHQGNLYGSTVIGGLYTCGTVFKLAPQNSAPWHESVLYNFDCYATGKSPHGGVTFDRSGNLEGTTVAGGTGGPCTSDGCGVVYQIAGSSETVRYNFTGAGDGFGPGGAVVFDRRGNAFGTTPDGGAFYQGVVYEITRAGKQRVLHAFTGGKDGGVGSLGSLLLDKSGAIYGVTELGRSKRFGHGLRDFESRQESVASADALRFQRNARRGVPLRRPCRRQIRQPLRYDVLRRRARSWFGIRAGS